jgi:peptide-methionine (S)-S-oxide reductase
MSAAFPTAPQLDAVRRSRERVAKATKAEVHTPIVESARFYLAEDYHQKYYLRGDPVLASELADYSPQAFVDSTVAARLNAYVAGHGSLAQLDAEAEGLGLSSAALTHLRNRVGSRRRWA